MTDNTVEQLSVLMDGECLAAERDFAIARLAKDDHLQGCWQRYHLISDALKNNLPDRIDARFAERVQQAIAADPALPAKLPFGAPAWYKPAVGFALAASVAVVGFVSFNLLQSTPPSGSSPPMAQGPMPPQGLPSNPKEAQLASYLASHNEYASMNSVHGVLPYVRLVGNETGR